MKKDARLIAMELRNWLNKNEYTLEELNRSIVVLRNGLLGNGNSKGQERKPVTSHPGASTAKRSVIKGLAEVSC